MKRRAYLRSLAGGATGAAGVAGAAGTTGLGGRLTTADGTETTTGDGDSETTTGDARFRVETVATELEVPWGVAFGPDGDLYLTERPGRIRRVGVDGEDGENRETVADFTDRIAHEGGLLGLAFHPDDPDLAYTYPTTAVTSPSTRTASPAARSTPPRATRGSRVARRTATRSPGRSSG